MEGGINMAKVTISNDIVVTAKKELFERIKANINLDRVREICADLYGVKDIHSLDFRNGDIVVHDGKIAYKIEFDVRFAVPLLIDEEGNLLGAQEVETEEEATPEGRIEDISQQASDTAQGF
jgi:hypothetical protein